MVFNAGKMAPSQPPPIGEELKNGEAIHTLIINCYIKRKNIV